MSMSESPRQEADSGNGGTDKEFSCRGCGKVYTTQGGSLRHMRKCCPDELHECPTCGKLLYNARGLSAHHTRSHDENIRKVSFKCDTCGSTAKKEPHHYNEEGKNYCSHECQGEDLRESVEITCENCEERVSVSPPSEAGEFCSRDCAHEYIRGENHHQYTGRPRYYGDRWEPQRRKARERDNFECQICGEGKDEIGRMPHVHHIQPVRNFDDPNDAHYLENLITLCPEHHIEWEGIPLRPH